MSTGITAFTYGTRRVRTAALDDADAQGEPDTDTEDTEATDEDEGADDEEA